MAHFKKSEDWIQTVGLCQLCHGHCPCAGFIFFIFVPSFDVIPSLIYV